MRRRHLNRLLLQAAGVVIAASPVATRSAEPEVDFRREVWPVIKAKCLECHNPRKRDGALDLSSRAAMLKGGNSGAAMIPGEVQKSLMIELIEFDEMPPRKSDRPRVTKAELKRLSEWIAAGAVVADEPSDPPVPDPRSGG